MFSILTGLLGYVYGVSKRSAALTTLATAFLCSAALQAASSSEIGRVLNAVLFLAATLFFLRPEREQGPLPNPTFVSTLVAKMISTLMNNLKILPVTVRIIRVLRPVLAFPINAAAALEEQNLKWKEHGRSLYFVIFAALVLIGITSLFLHLLFFPGAWMFSISSAQWRGAGLFLWMLLAFLILPRFHKANPGFFSFFLCLSGFTQLLQTMTVIPGFDFLASALPLIGLLMDFMRPFPGTSSDSSFEVQRLKRRIEEMEKNEMFWRLITQNAADIVVVMDFTGAVTYVSPSLERVLGYKPKELLGRSGFELVHPDDYKVLMPVYHKLAENPGSVNGAIFRFRHKDGSWHVIETIGTSLFDHPAVKGMISNTRDITTLKETEEELRKTTQELGRSNAELAQFAYVASHDLQEPLRKIIAFGNLLKTEHGEKLEPEARDYCERMQNAAARMRQLIEDLLSFSRVTTKAKPFEKVSLNTIVREVLNDLEVRLQETQGKIERGELPEVYADPLQMRQLFQNLIGNALKYRKKDAAPVITIETRALGNGFAEFAIKDNGIGFDNQYAERIFKPFERLHGRTSEYEGTGIGLAICEKIVLRHGGAIKAESAPGVGSTFRFTLPLVNEKESL